LTFSYEKGSKEAVTRLLLFYITKYHNTLLLEVIKMYPHRTRGAPTGRADYKTNNPKEVNQ